MANATSHSRVSTRTLAMALMAVAIAASLAACGGGGGSTSTPEQAPASVVITPVAPVVPVVTACDTTIGTVVGGVCMFQSTVVVDNSGPTKGSIFSVKMVALKPMTVYRQFPFDGKGKLPLSLACAVSQSAYADGLHATCRLADGKTEATYALGIDGATKVLDAVYHGTEPEYAITRNFAAMPRGCDLTTVESYALVASGACLSFGGFTGSLGFAGKVLALESVYGTWSYGPK